MFFAAFASLSSSYPHDGHECSRTHRGLSVSTPQLLHSLVVPRGLTSTRCVLRRLALGSAFDARFASIDDAFDVVVELVVEFFGTAFVSGRERFDRFADLTAMETGEFKPFLHR